MKNMQILGVSLALWGTNFAKNDGIFTNFPKNDGIFTNFVGNHFKKLTVAFYIKSLQETVKNWLKIEIFNIFTHFGHF